MKSKQGHGLRWLPAALLFSVAAVRAGDVAAPEHTNVYRSRFEEGAKGERWSDAKTHIGADGSSFLGEFARTDQVHLTLDELPKHTHIRLRFELRALNTWDGVIPGVTPDSWGVMVRGGPLLLITSFCNQRRKFLSLREDEAPQMQSYPDELPLAIHEATTGGAGEGDASVQWFDDAPAGTESVYPIDLVFPHVGDELVLRFFGHLDEASSDESWGLAQVVVDTIDGTTPVATGERDALWAKICGKDPVAANAAVWRFIAGGPDALTFVQNRWDARSATDREHERLADEALRARTLKIVADLASEGFATRQRARKALGELGTGALDLLIEQLAHTSDPEMRIALTPVVTDLRITAKYEAKRRPIHEQVVRSRVEHILRVLVYAANGFTVTSSAGEKSKHPIDAPATGFVPERSDCVWLPRHTWSARDKGETWLQYDFPAPRTISEAGTFWYFGDDPDGTVDLPASWRVNYRGAGGEWHPVVTGNPYAIRAHRMNTVRFSPVRTSAIRLNVERRPELGAAILQLQIGSREEASPDLPSPNPEEKSDDRHDES